MYEDILVPVDGSEPALASVEHGAGLAAMHDAQLHLLHVVDTRTLVDAATGDILGALEEAGEQALQRARDVAAEAGVDAVEASVVQGIPQQAIVDVVDERGIDLVVMGTHGRTGLDRLLLGSVTESVVRLSPVPVMTVRQAAE